MPQITTPNRIRYVLPFSHSRPGHRLGINSLALDTTTVTNNATGQQGILYSAGRDGMVSAWNLNLQLRRRATQEVNGSTTGDIFDDDGRRTTLVASGKSDRAREWDVEGEMVPPTSFRAQVQAHTHWVNDILLAHESTSVISCSSDMTVKLWRPHSAERAIPTTLGNHADYVKCLASPGDATDWVASGGLDRKIVLWDVNGKGEIQKIEVGEQSEGPKSSVYALGTGGGILASGGPEKVVRIWDPKSGKRITKFVGHTDNIRSILLSDDGRTMLTASSDATIKLWSLATRRCLHAFTMHNDSVWTLHSLDPYLKVFHAGDRSGLVTKTDIRNVGDIDEAECVAVCKEHHGVTKIVAVGNRIWSATSSSSINRWLDTPDWDPLPPLPAIPHRTSSVPRHRPSAAQGRPSVSLSVPTIPPLAFLRLTSIHDTLLQVGPISNKDQDVASVFTAQQPSSPTFAPVLSDEPQHIVPVRDEPEATIAGQHGLIKHILLNDRRRVLTLDTSHTVALWDLIECRHVQSFGAKDIHEVEKQINSNESVPNWCTVDTRIGSITVMLDERSAFDAEVYRDEMGYQDDSDQRINIGKWVLRYLFGKLIDVELQRDEKLRETLEKEAVERTRNSSFGPLFINIPPPVHISLSSDQLPRQRVHGGATSPGIGLATPAPMYDPSPGRTSFMSSDNEFTTLTTSNKDYFSKPVSVNGDVSQIPPTPSIPAEIPSSIEPPKESTFLSRLKSFGSRKAKVEKDDVTSPPTTNGVEKDETAEKTEEGATNGGGSRRKEKPYMFTDVLAAIRKTYEIALNAPEAPEKSDVASLNSISKIPVLEDGRLRSAITPSMPDDTPIIRPSPDTIIIIAEQRVNVDGSMDLYRGTVESIGNDVDRLENVAPGWLGELLLLNKLPKKEVVKISFALKPHPSSVLPDMLGGNPRLNANRLLRARKVVAYVADRIESDCIPRDGKEHPDTWLELLCQEKIVPLKWTLQTIRTQMWKQGGDILFTYRLKSEEVNSS